MFFLAAEIVWNLIWRQQSKIPSCYIKIFFLGTAKVWAAVKTIISIFENDGYLYMSESLFVSSH